METKEQKQNELARIKQKIEQAERELNVLHEAKKTVEQELIYLESTGENEK